MEAYATPIKEGSLHLRAGPKAYGWGCAYEHVTVMEPHGTDAYITGFVVEQGEFTPDHLRAIMAVLGPRGFKRLIYDRITPGQIEPVKVAINIKESYMDPQALFDKATASLQHSVAVCTKHNRQDAAAKVQSYLDAHQNSLAVLLAATPDNIDATFDGLRPLVGALADLVRFGRADTTHPQDHEVHATIKHAIIDTKHIAMGVLDGMIAQMNAPTAP